MKCPYCGREYHTQVKFCAQCGNRIDNQEPKKKNSQMLLAAIAAMIVIVLVLAISLFYVMRSKNYKHQMALGDQYYQQKQYKEAEEAYSKALKIRGKSDEACVGKAKAAMASADYKKADAAAEKALQFNPQNGEAACIAIDSLIQLDKLDQAKTIADQAEKNIDSKEIKARSEKLEKNQKARQAYAQILEQYQAFLSDDTLKKAVEEDKIDLEKSFPDIYSTFLDTYVYSHIPRFYYAYYDIDSNGMPEMLISATEGEHGTRDIIGLYGYDGEAVNELIRFVAVYDEDENRALPIDAITDAGQIVTGDFDQDTRKVYVMDESGTKINLTNEVPSLNEASIPWKKIDGQREVSYDLGQFGGRYINEDMFFDITLDSVGDGSYMYCTVGKTDQAMENLELDTDFKVEGNSVKLVCQYETDDGGQREGYTMTVTRNDDETISVSTHIGNPDSESISQEGLQVLQELAKGEKVFHLISEDDESLLNYHYYKMIHAEENFNILFNPGPWGDEETVFNTIPQNLGAMNRVIDDFDGNGIKEMAVTSIDSDYNMTLSIGIDLYGIRYGNVVELTDKEITWEKGLGDSTHMQLAWKKTKEGTFFYMADCQLGNKHEGAPLYLGSKIYRYAGGKCEEVLQALPPYGSMSDTDYMSPVREYLPGNMDAFYDYAIKAGAIEWYGADNGMLYSSGLDFFEKMPLAVPLNTYDKDLKMFALIEVFRDSGQKIGDDYNWPGHWKSYVE